MSTQRTTNVPAAAADQEFMEDILRILARYQSRAHSEAVKAGIVRAKARKAAAHVGV